MRREFELGAEDVRALDALGLSWETIRYSGSRWLLIHRFPIPAGYTCEAATIAFRLDTYPPGLIDMAYFDPPLVRTDGKAINNLSPLVVDNRTFQQWSRHYGWQTGIHTLETHIRRARAWLSHEFRKR